MTKKYESPILEVKQVKTESIITNLGTYNVYLKDWQKDATSNASYEDIYDWRQNREIV